MAEKRGIYRILSSSLIYSIVQKIFYDEHTTHMWKALMMPNSKGKVLDIGCGPGEDSKIFFSKSESYVGVDLSEEYIQNARENYSDYGVFYQSDVANLSSLNLGLFDLITLKGVSHHLSDGEVLNTLESLKKLLTPNGVIITIDPTLIEQRLLANKIVSLDRGMHIRKPPEIVNLCREVFPKVEEKIITQSFFYQRVMLRLSI